MQIEREKKIKFRYILMVVNALNVQIIMYSKEKIDAMREMHAKIIQMKQRKLGFTINSVRDTFNVRNNFRMNSSEVNNNEIEKFINNFFFKR